MRRFAFTFTTLGAIVLLAGSAMANHPRQDRVIYESPGGTHQTMPVQRFSPHRMFSPSPRFPARGPVQHHARFRQRGLGYDPHLTMQLASTMARDAQFLVEALHADLGDAHPEVIFLAQEFAAAAREVEHSLQAWGVREAVHPAVQRSNRAWQRLRRQIQQLERFGGRWLPRSLATSRQIQHDIDWLNEEVQGMP